ncbi:MAG: hypothetical protein EOP66_10540 [Sphingomonas sp.]|nr:MAG: hypothetical protein EOP66_10540 [Sphingomonas sp.]
MNVKFMVAGVILIVIIASAVRWQRKVARTMRYGERRHRRRKQVKRDTWATKWLRKNPLLRMIERRHYRVPGKTDQTL